MTWEKRLSSSYKNICIKPSDWLTFLFRYISTTDDDFESFVSFLKLNSHRESFFNEDTIAFIMNETPKYDLSDEDQREMINNYLVNNYDKIKEFEKNKNYEGIEEVVKDSTIEFLKQKYEEASNSYTDELEGKNKTNMQLIKENDLVQDKLIESEKEKDTLQKASMLSEYNALEAKKKSILYGLSLKWIVIVLISIAISIAPKEIFSDYLSYGAPGTLLGVCVLTLVLNKTSSFIDSWNLPTFNKYRLTKKEYSEFRKKNEL